MKKTNGKKEGGMISLPSQHDLEIILGPSHTVKRGKLPNKSH